MSYKELEFCPIIYYPVPEIPDFLSNFLLTHFRKFHFFPVYKVACFQSVYVLYVLVYSICIVCASLEYVCCMLCVGLGQYKACR